jgi:hypothetical protein
MERVVSRPNMLAAYKRVRENKGSPGIDGLTVEDLQAWLAENWIRVREELLAGAYRPTPPCFRFSSRSSTRLSPITAMGSDRDAERTMPYGVRKDMSRPAAAGWWTWTWRSSSTG